MPPKPAASTQALPAKEQALFKQLLQMYEAKQYKKAIKTADQILKKFPEHGESLCMKGLLISMTGKKEEGLDMAKRGARFNLTSHIVWHVLGLIHKADRNYEEANRSYGQALRFDKDNVNLLRDSASLQMQLRLFDQLQDTRWSILRLRPNVRSHWIALAVASQLAGNLEQSDKVLASYSSMIKNVPDYDFDFSETSLYHIRVLEELGKLDEALIMLEASIKSRSIVDRLALLELRPRLLAKLGRTDEAEAAYRAIIERNPDNAAYIEQLAKLKGLASTDSLELLADLETKVPKGSAPTRIALDVATGDEFDVRVRKYIETGLTRGVPSLFTDIKPLYSDPAKRTAIERAALAFHDTVAPTAGGEPSTYLWSLYFLAQHWSKLGNQPRALDLIDTALAHTPTLPELYTFRGRILKRAGAPQSAAVAVERARLLDGQDRFLNGKAAKYLLRAGRVEDAETRLSMFTRKDAPFAAADLEELQSTAFLLQAGAAHEAGGRLGKALRKYVGVVRVFDDVEDDQYDFHGYVMRRFTINVYSDFLTYLDRSRSQPAYITAALGAVRIYLRLHDDPGLAAALLAPPKQTEAEKKAKKKAQKEAAKAKETAAASTKKTDAKKKDKEDDEDEDAPTAPTKFEDQDGVKLLSAADPLEQAAKILRPLETLVDRADVWAVVYDVAVRRKKLLQATKALNRIAKLDPESPVLHVRLIDLRKQLATEGTDAAPIAVAADGTDASRIVRSALEALFPADVTPEAFSSQYLQRNSGNPAAVLAVASVSPVAQAEELLFGLVPPESGLSVQIALEAVALLEKLKSTRVDELKTAYDARFPLSSVFKSLEEQMRLATVEEATLDTVPTSDEVLDLEKQK
ncbi:N-terminal acetyltransferase A, auxiliary subunit [Auriculariales sp. MPI-PUGE-AT-0066]|nr:N-terminal acetyltransferase A, auxiliary subunit [Auriculariales sp. MPI-PUGE-AT-0066]